MVPSTTGALSQPEPATQVSVVQGLASSQPAWIGLLTHPVSASQESAVQSMPSLHAGLATYSALYGQALLAPRRSGWLLAIGLTAWVLAILYATLATKQHWAVDLPPAIGLAWVAHYLVRARPASPSS